MEKITKKQVEHIAYLSRLSLSEKELEIYSNQLEVILEYMEKLNFLDTSNVEPVSSIITLYKNQDIKPHYRNDEVINFECQKEILANAPSRVNNFFKVEKILE